jgi:amino acid transporter
MVLDIINKVIVIVYILACLNVFRHTYYFIQSWFKSNGEAPQKYKIARKSLVVLGISLAFIISSFVIGITI